MKAVKPFMAFESLKSMKILYAVNRKIEQTQADF